VFGKAAGESATTGEGRFRVNANANAKLLDVWLLVRCVSARRIISPWTGRAWRLDTPSAWLDEVWRVQVEVSFEDPMAVPPERLTAQDLQSNAHWRSALAMSWAAR
jgi:hypothetical protein